MGIPKAPFVRDRICSIGPGFGWVDHRLVREHYVERCSHGALALYLFLGSKNHLSPRFAKGGVWLCNSRFKCTKIADPGRSAGVGE